MPVNRHTVPLGACVLGLALALALTAPVAATQDLPEDLAARLTPAQQRAYIDYRAARGAFDRDTRTYWSKVEAKRNLRKAKRVMRQEYEAGDYMPTHPPKYLGPELPPDVAKILAELRPAVEQPPLPGVADFLAAAKAQFGFVPKRVSEIEFKRRYAAEALKVGLSKEQVVRVYALETGGLGTYDTLSGINPATKLGKPASSALGYSQLLHANSVGGIAKHGEEFVRRMLAMAAAPGASPERAAELKKKAAIVRRMIRAARTVPYEWGAHTRFANTLAGLGIHAVNLDVDLGTVAAGDQAQVAQGRCGRGRPSQTQRRRARAHESRRAAHGARDDDAARRPACRPPTSSARAPMHATRSCATSRRRSCWRFSTSAWRRT